MKADVLKNEDYKEGENEIEGFEDGEDEGDEAVSEGLAEETTEFASEVAVAVDEEEEEEEEIPVKKKRCERRKKPKICFDEAEAEEDEEDELVIGEDGDDEEGEEDEEEELDNVSIISSAGYSVLSSVSFEWEDKVYEFEELCDPGTIRTIFKKQPLKLQDTWDETGRLQYLLLCSSFSIAPSKRFYDGLESEKIDLSYRGIDNKSMRAMCAALVPNSFVKYLILKYCGLTKDDCYFMNLMLRENEILTHLDLTGCRIGAEGMKMMEHSLSRNEGLQVLKLSKCYVEDEGVSVISSILIRNNAIQELDLSYNKLGEESANSLGFAFKYNSCLKILNLRYNYLFEPTALKVFFGGLRLNNSIADLNLAWNGLNGEIVGSYIGNMLKKNQALLHLDLSDNRLEGNAIRQIKSGLDRNRSLESLRLGRNPMSMSDMDRILNGAKGCTSLKFLDLEDLCAAKSFLKILKNIQKDRDIEVNIGGINSNYVIQGPDYSKVILERAQYEAMKPKKKKLRKDFGHLMWKLGDEPMTKIDFMNQVTKFKAKVNKELYPELMKEFTDPKTQMIDVVAMRKKYLSLFPDSTPPPPPKEKSKSKKGKTQNIEKREGLDKESEEKNGGESEKLKTAQVSFIKEFYEEGSAESLEMDGLTEETEEIDEEEYEEQYEAFAKLEDEAFEE